MIPRPWLLIFLCLLMLLAAPARGHDVVPAYLELRQTDPTHLEVVWKVPARPLLGTLKPEFPAPWKTIGTPEELHTADAVTQRMIVECPGIEGARITVTGLETVLADVMVRVVRLDGTAVVTRLNPAMPAFTIEHAPGLLHTAATFTRLGIEHILMGVDHLLFVLGLLLIVRSRWMLFKTITSFTIAHSLTLAVATLGYASAPTAPLNAAIALSILFLGPEIVRRRRGQTSLTIEHPWVVGFAFGLLHGFGFASGLTSLGLSPREIPLALLLFNVGVEIGQLFFVFVILGLARSFLVLEMRWPRWVQWLPAYTVGSLGAFWTIQRIIFLF